MAEKWDNERILMLIDDAFDYIEGAFRNGKKVDSLKYAVAKDVTREISLTVYLDRQIKLDEEEKKKLEEQKANESDDQILSNDEIAFPTTIGENEDESESKFS